jgi:hypothetical protein
MPPLPRHYPLSRNSTLTGTATFVAISANTHKITVIAYALTGDKNPHQVDPPAQIESRPLFPHSRRTESVFTLEAQNNIPALAFDNNDPLGRWLYSSGVDGQTIQWDLHKITKAATYQMGWCARYANALKLSSMTFRFQLQSESRLDSASHLLHLLLLPILDIR